jgi:hypothetical protein
LRKPCDALLVVPQREREQDRQDRVRARMRELLEDQIKERSPCQRGTGCDEN